MPSSWIARAFPIAGLALIVRIAFFEADRPSLFMAGWSLYGAAPYVICLVAMHRMASPWPAAIGAALALAWDLIVYVEVFLRPTDAQAGLLLLFSPQFGVLLACLAITLGSELRKWRERRAAMANTSGVSGR